MKKPAAGDHQRHGDVDGVVAKGNIRGAHRNERAEEQRVKDVQVAPYVMPEFFHVLCCHNCLYQV
jgi:hypothetical protein